MNPEIIDLSFAYGQVNSPQLENKANEARTDLRKEIWRSLLPLNGLIKAVKVPYNEIGNACEIPSEYNTPKMIGYSSIESNTRPMEHYIWILQTGKPKESVDIGDGGGVGLNNLRALFTVQEILDMMKGKVYFKTGGVTSGMGAAIETYIGFDNIHKKQEYKSGSYVYEYPEPFCYQYSGGNMVDNRNQEVESTPTISNNSLFSNGQPVNINNLPVYELETNHNQGMVLDAESGSTANGTNVIQFPRNGHENTKWVLQPAVQEGYFFIINKKSEKVMAVKGKSNQNDAQIVLNTFNSVAHENQLVKVTQINNTDYYSFQFKSSGKYLTIGTGGEKVTKGDQREKLYQRDLIAFPQPIGANVTPNNKRQYFKLKSLNNTGSSTTESVTISLKNSSIKTLKFFLSYTENGKNKTTDVTNSFTSGITKSVSISANATNLKITVLNALNSNVLNTSNLTNASICYKYRSGDITQCN